MPYPEYRYQVQHAGYSMTYSVIRFQHAGCSMLFPIYRYRYTGCSWNLDTCYNMCMFSSVQFSSNTWLKLWIFGTQNCAKINLNDYNQSERSTLQTKLIQTNQSAPSLLANIVLNPYCSSDLGTCLPLAEYTLLFNTSSVFYRGLYRT